MESSPVVVGQTLYFGSKDRKVYALRLRGRKRPTTRWTFTADDEIVAAPAYSQGKIFAVTSNGSVYAIDARNGREVWHATSFSRFGGREYFYATPAVAYGRVYAPNADGTVYAYGAQTGKLLWARQVGTYAYTAPAVWRRTVYVGTWDGYFVALDAVTGDVRWRFDAPSTISGAPTVLVRPRLLLELRALWNRWIAASRARPAPHVRAECAQRRRRLDVLRRQVLADRVRRPPRLPDGQEQDLRAHSSRALGAL